MKNSIIQALPNEWNTIVLNGNSRIVSSRLCNELFKVQTRSGQKK